ncbi:MAG TPA: hypothetical protein VMU38_06310 [Candidatus Binatia bacterium]|nr:hypothetical protein [Candidatus Binatia bacterium]
MTGLFVIGAVEAIGWFRPIPQAAHDLGLVVGGGLVGLIVFWIDETYVASPERKRAAEERESERQRHQEERRLDFEQFRALQSELRECRLHAASLQAKIDFTGAVDRDRVGDALLLGFYFHRRNERLPSDSRQSIFNTAAMRLRLLTNAAQDINVDKDSVRGVIEMAYGPIVSEGFDLGYVLSHLDENVLPSATSPEIMMELERHLSELKVGAERVQPEPGTAASDDASGLFTRLTTRIISILRRKR